MTKPVTLSEEAFRELRREKRPEESTSDAILRLIRNSKERQDPSKLFRLRLKRVMSRGQHLAMVRGARDRDTRDPWSE